eukprot:COSAG02_NODE_8448_length_2568_cov_1.404212_1_plen_85_part_00
METRPAASQASRSGRENQSQPPARRRTLQRLFRTGRVRLVQRYNLSYGRTRVNLRLHTVVFALRAHHLLYTLQGTLREKQGEIQ